MGGRAPRTHRFPSSERVKNRVRSCDKEIFPCRPGAKPGPTRPPRRRSQAVQYLTRLERCAAEQWAPASAGETSGCVAGNFFHTLFRRSDRRMGGGKILSHTLRCAVVVSLASRTALGARRA